MCGIAGFYAAAASESLLERMTDSLSHRGPDSRGYVAFTRNTQKSWHIPGHSERNHEVGLGNRRLKILDLSDHGRQPMSTPDRRFWLTFNGLIFNYTELKEKLPDTSFVSSCDTEVLLHLLAKYGKPALGLLNGIFAFAFYDSVEKKLLLARDPVGVKPLYYSHTNSGFFFGSEIKSILPALSGRPRMRTDLLARYFLNSWMPDPDTLFEGIYKIPPGFALTIEPDKSSLDRYWDLSYGREESLSLEQWKEGLDNALAGAVERQMRSDVPLAFFLSGGIDSSLLAAKAARLNRKPPTTYTIGFEWSRSQFDRLDLESARIVANRFGLEHREIILSPSILSLLPKIIETLEEPIADTAAICSYLICEAARSDFTVLISGQGGDELFGGYPVFRGGLAAKRLAGLPIPILAILDSVANNLPYRVLGKRLQTVTRLKKLFFSAESSWPEPFVRMRSPIRVDQVDRLLTPEIARLQKAPFAPQMALFENAREWDPAHQMLYLDFKTFLPALNLTYTDKTSMAHSVDVRVPLLDLDIIRFVERMPSNLKFSAFESKILLKKVARGLLPDSIVDRKKSGFGLPLKDWLVTDLQPLARECLSPELLRRQGLFDAKLVERWLTEHSAEKADHSFRIYALMTLQLWMDRQGINL